ncbi:uncharacterized protein V1518DRAFT_244186 [Limtongia smithiae]|uniref:uncharacterized protein n=1 Tax=Limtongia smithiae TaxID=1125753 RepID=UPI0034CD08C3
MWSKCAETVRRLHSYWGTVACALHDLRGVVEYWLVTDGADCGCEATGISTSASNFTMTRCAGPPQGLFPARGGPPKLGRLSRPRAARPGEERVGPPGRRPALRSSHRHGRPVAKCQPPQLRGSDALGALRIWLVLQDDGRRLDNSELRSPTARTAAAIWRCQARRHCVEKEGGSVSCRVFAGAQVQKLRAAIRVSYQTRLRRPATAVEAVKATRDGYCLPY